MNRKNYWQHIIRYGLMYSVVLFALQILALHYLALPKISNATVQRLPDPTTYPITLPYYSPAFHMPYTHPENTPARYSYTFDLQYSPGQQSKFMFHPIGCVEQVLLNNIPIPLRTANLCGMDPGFTIDLGPHLQPGPSKLQVKVTNLSGFRYSRNYDTATYGLHIGPKLFQLRASSLSNKLVYGMLITFTLALMCFMRKFTGEYISGLIIGAGIFFFSAHFARTNFMQYTIDMPSHLQYIIFIAKHGFWPKIYQGWEFYHPPLYYDIAAQIIRFSNYLGSFDAITMIRTFSLFCFIAFIVFSALSLQRIISNRAAYYVVLTMLVFYPTGVIFATRLDSHILYYTFYSACIYFLLRWIQDKKLNFLWAALMASGLAIGTRSNALVLAPLIIAAVLYQWRNSHFSFSSLLSLRCFICVLIIMAGLMGNFGRTAYYRITENNSMPYVVGNIASIQQTQRITNSFEHLFLLDFQQLFNPPFLTWWHDYTGRQYFWNGMLKTSLFEHFNWRATSTAKFLLLNLLLLVLYILLSVFNQKSDKRLALHLCTVSLLFPVTLLMINRIFHPYAPSQDFRYIYPALTAFCGLIGLVLEQQLKHNYFTYAATGVVLIFAFTFSAIVLIFSG